MEKSKSYYDWELQFRNHPKKGTQPNQNKKKLNSLGLTTEEFKSFLKKWKVKNLQNDG